jgi:isocitrate/isopropylmalate dehydrogenase
VWRIALLPGDGSELIAAARRALEAVAEVRFADVVAGCDAVLSDRPLPALATELGHDTGLLAFRAIPLLVDASPLREPRIARTDALLVRGLAGGAADGVARHAFAAAERRRGRLAEVGGGPLCQAVERLAGEHPDVAVEHLSDGEAASELVANPSRFDVLACAEPPGTALAGVAAAITGTAQMLPGASLGARPPGIFSPAASGTAGIRNPLATVLAAALLLREGLVLEAEAERLEVAVELALETGLRTPDMLLGGVGERRAGTEALAAAVLSGLEQG